MVPFRAVRRSVRASVTTALLVATALAPAACGDDPASPGIDAVAGSYAATEFTVTEAGATTDLLATGASLQLDLAVDRSVTGRLFVPDADEGGGDLDAQLTGTWTLDGSTVRFTQPEDTFVRDTPFTFADGELRADRTFGTARVRVTLRRTP